MAFTLLVQALIPFAQALPSPNDAGPLIICTQFGLRVLNPAQAPDTSRSRATDPAACAVCISLDSARLSAPMFGQVTREFPPICRMAYDEATVALLPGQIKSLKWPRAPPSVT
ncbi:hypothetical protein JCM17960_05150 [Magnetospira thiophila]